MTFTKLALSFTLITWANAETMTVSCTPSTPVVRVHDSVKLTAATSGSTSNTRKYAWSPDAGSIAPPATPPKAGKSKITTVDTVWKLEDAEIGPYVAELQITDKGKKVGSCNVEVRVVRELTDTVDTRGGSRETARAMLTSDQTEPAGYGLYSYVLLGGAPEDAQKDRYKKVLEGVLKMMPALNEIQKYLAPAQLNATFVPVKKAPDANMDAAWLLDNYDYARARALLLKAPVSGKTGIYIVSSSVPLAATAGNAKFLVQDLSEVPPNLISTWIDVFLNQAAQERYWEASTGANFVLKLRLSLAVISIGTPQVQEALTKWISWKS